MTYSLTHLLRDNLKAGDLAHLKILFFFISNKYFHKYFYVMMMMILKPPLQTRYWILLKYSWCRQQELWIGQNAKVQQSFAYKSAITA